MFAASPSRAVGDAQREVVSSGFEDRQCLCDQRLQLGGGIGRLELEPLSGLVDPPAQLADRVVGGGGA